MNFLYYSELNILLYVRTIYYPWTLIKVYRIFILNYNWKNVYTEYFVILFLRFYKLYNVKHLWLCSSNVILENKCIYNKKKSDGDRNSSITLVKA